MTKEIPDQGLPLSKRKTGILIAFLAGIPCFPLGLIASPLTLHILTKILKRKNGKEPNRFIPWAIIGSVAFGIHGEIRKPPSEQLISDQDIGRHFADIHCGRKSMENGKKGLIRLGVPLKKIEQVQRFLGNDTSENLEAIGGMAIGSAIVGGYIVRYSELKSLEWCDESKNVSKKGEEIKPSINSNPSILPSSAEAPIPTQIAPTAAKQRMIREVPSFDSLDAGITGGTH